MTDNELLDRSAQDSVVECFKTFVSAYKIEVGAEEHFINELRRISEARKRALELINTLDSQRSPYTLEK